MTGERGVICVRSEPFLPVNRVQQCRSSNRPQLRNGRTRVHTIAIENDDNSISSYYYVKIITLDVLKTIIAYIRRVTKIAVIFNVSYLSSTRVHTTALRLTRHPTTDISISNVIDFQSVRRFCLHVEVHTIRAESRPTNRKQKIPQTTSL